MPTDFESPSGRFAWGRKRDLGWVTDDIGNRYFVIHRRTLMSEEIETRVPVEAAAWEGIWRRYAESERRAARQWLAQRSADLAKQEAEAERLRELGAAEIEQLRQTGVEDSGPLEAGLLGRISGLVLLGGHGEGLGVEIGAAYDAWFRDREMVLTETSKRYALFAWPYEDIEAVEITGPGAVTRGGGMIGGGFGVTGALEGMAIASIINALTTRTTVKTVLRIESREAELFLLNSVHEPDALRVMLSPVFGRLKRVARNQPVLPGESTDPVERLTRLAALVEKGLFTRAEFERLKARLLEGI